MNNLEITEKIINLLKEEISLIMLKDEEYYSGYNFYISNEQQYIKNSKREKGAIYIVVKFLPSTLNFGQVVLPISINAIAEKNKIEVCQKLLFEFAETYNLQMSEDGTINQIYTSPSIISNFNDVFDGFRSLFHMSGTFIVSENSNRFSIVFGGENVECITQNFSYRNQMNVTTKYEVDDLTSSISRVGTIIISFTHFLVDDLITNTILDVALGNASSNSSFEFNIEFKNGYSLVRDFKLVDFTMQQNIGENPVYSATFTI